jgi:hypothetical protein
MIFVASVGLNRDRPIYVRDSILNMQRKLFITVEIGVHLYPCVVLSTSR